MFHFKIFHNKAIFRTAYLNLLPVHEQVESLWLNYYKGCLNSARDVQAALSVFSPFPALCCGANSFGFTELDKKKMFLKM